MSSLQIVEFEILVSLSVGFWISQNPQTRKTRQRALIWDSVQAHLEMVQNYIIAWKIPQECFRL